MAALTDAGLDVTPLREWVVAWPSSKQLREDLASATLYLTLEPSNERQGETLPPVTQLIQQSGIHRVVIGCPHPVPELATEGAASLHSSGIQVSMGIEQDDCAALVTQYSALANTKLQKNARKHFQRYGVVSYSLLSVLICNSCHACPLIIFLKPIFIHEIATWILAL